MRRIDAQTEADIVTAYTAGGAFNDICKQFQIGTSTLARILKRNDIDARGQTFSLPISTLVEMAALYKSGFTCAEIAVHYQTSEFKVRYSLQKRLGLKLRRVGTRYVAKAKRDELAKFFKRLWNDPVYRRIHLPITLASGFRKHTRNLPKTDYSNSLPQVKELRDFVLKRDNHRCRKCKSGRRLHIHHDRPWRDFPTLRFEPNNVITLCQSCHMRLEALLKHKRSLDDFRDVLPIRVR